jgi:hypothetical protein
MWVLSHDKAEEEPVLSHDKAEEEPEVAAPSPEEPEVVPPAAPSPDAASLALQMRRHSALWPFQSAW